MKWNLYMCQYYILCLLSKPTQSNVSVQINKYVIEMNDFVAKRNSLNTDVEYRTKLNLLSFILNRI